MRFNCILIILGLAFSNLSGGEPGAVIEGKVGFKLSKPLKYIDIGLGGSITTDQPWLNNILNLIEADSLVFSFDHQNHELRTYYSVYFPEIIQTNYVLNIFRNEEVVVDAWKDKQGVFFDGVNTNDSLSDQQWSLHKISIEGAWPIESGSSEIIVAILDSGIDLGLPDGPLDPHPDLAQNMWNENGLYGLNILNPSEAPREGEGSHGTKMAGLTAAITNNGTGIAGVAGGGFQGDSGVEILIVKTGNDGPGSAESIAEGIIAATEAGARVINISGGLHAVHYCDEDPEDVFRDFPTLEAGVTYALERDVAIVTATGNNDWDVSNCCPSCDEFMAVYPAVYASLGYDIVSRQNKLEQLA